MAVKKRTPSELHLEARIAELEGQLEARTQTIVTLAARIRELEGGQTAALVEQAERTRAELEQLRSTKLFRLAAGPRRVYAKLLAVGRG